MSKKIKTARKTKKLGTDIQDLVINGYKIIIIVSQGETPIKNVPLN